MIPNTATCSRAALISAPAWTTPQVVPGYDYAGTECAGLTRLSCGRIFLNQWQNRWYPLDLARSHPAEPMQFPDEFVAELIQSAELDTGAQISGNPEEFAPWARGHGRSYVHASDDNGESFTHTTIIDTGPFHGGYGLRGCVELPDGSLLLPLNDIPEFRTIFTVVSADRGESWHSPRLVARAEGRLFTEPAMVLAANGDVVCMMRDDTTRIMHCCRSADGGKELERGRGDGHRRLSAALACASGSSALVYLWHAHTGILHPRRALRRSRAELDDRRAHHHPG